MQTAERSEVVEWAYNLLKKDFVVLDTETTGKMDDPKLEIVQLGIIDKYGSTVMDQMFKPKGDITLGAQNVHHIRPIDVENKPKFNELYPLICEKLSGKLIIAYNIAFDKLAMNNTCKMWGVPPLENEWDCAMLAYAKYYGEWNDYRGNWRWWKLVEAAAELGVEVIKAHDALGDVKMTLKVVQALAKQHPEYVQFT